MGERTGNPRGRPKGAKNKRSVELAQQVEALAKQIGAEIPDAFEGDAHAFLMAIYKDPRLPIGIRTDAAKAAVPYEKPRLQAIEHTGEDGGPIETISKIERVIVDPAGQDP